MVICSLQTQVFQINTNYSYHDREYNGGHSGLKDPEQSQAKDLNEGEEVDLPEGNVSQVNQVRLMLCWHQKQFETIHELQTDRGASTHDRMRCMNEYCISEKRLVAGLFLGY